VSLATAKQTKTYKHRRAAGSVDWKRVYNVSTISPVLGGVIRPVLTESSVDPADLNDIRHNIFEVKRTNKSKYNSEDITNTSTEPNNMNVLADSLTEKEVQLIKEAAIKAGMSEAAATAAAEAASKVIVKEKIEAKEQAAKIAAESPPPKQPLLMMQEAGMLGVNNFNHSESDKDKKTSQSNNADWLAMWGKSLAEMADANTATTSKHSKPSQDKRYPPSSALTGGGGSVGLYNDSSAAVRASELAKKRKAAAAHEANMRAQQGKWPISKPTKKEKERISLPQRVPSRRHQQARNNGDADDDEDEDDDVDDDNDNDYEDPLPQRSHQRCKPKASSDERKKNKSVSPDRKKKAAAARQRAQKELDSEASSVAPSKVGNTPGERACPSPLPLPSYQPMLFVVVDVRSLFSPHL
jgi:hypothetical protein